MNVVLIPAFRDIFHYQGESYDDLVSDIPSKIIITVMSHINNQLSHSSNDEKTQLNIFNFISQKFPTEVKKSIVRRLDAFRLKVNSEIAIFGMRYTMEVINRELIKYREFDYYDTSPEHELRLFKAYLMIVDELTENDASIFSKSNHNFSTLGIKTILWPFAVKVFEFTYPKQAYPIIEGIKSQSFLEYCQRDDKIRPHIESFLSRVHCKSIQDYSGRILSLSRLSVNDRESGLNNQNVFTTLAHDILLSSFTMTTEDISEYKNHNKDFVGIKNKPILKLDDKYVVMHWNYLFNKLFSGLVFSLYYDSTLNLEFKSFDSYKAHIGTAFSHRTLFKGILNECFSSYDCIWFDEENNQDKSIFNPDCYFRIGKNIFIVEFKDTLLNKEIIHSEDFDKIKSEIDKKFIASKGKKKGISQLVRNLEILGERSPKFDKIFNHNKHKVRNYCVYPLIIHTNYYFAIPGLNEYINQEFSRQTQHLKNNFKPLKPVTVINIDFFIEKLMLLKCGKIHLDNLIDEYYKKINSYRRKIRVGDPTDIEYLISSMMSFDEYIFRKQSKIPQTDYTESLDLLYSCLQIYPPTQEKG